MDDIFKKAAEEEVTMSKVADPTGGLLKRADPAAENLRLAAATLGPGPTAADRLTDAGGGAFTSHFADLKEALAGYDRGLASNIQRDAEGGRQSVTGTADRGPTASGCVWLRRSSGSIQDRESDKRVGHGRREAKRNNETR